MCFWPFPWENLGTAVCNSSNPWRKALLKTNSSSVLLVNKTIRKWNPPPKNPTTLSPQKPKQKRILWELVFHFRVNWSKKASSKQIKHFCKSLQNTIININRRWWKRASIWTVNSIIRREKKMKTMKEEPYTKNQRKT